MVLEFPKIIPVFFKFSKSIALLTLKSNELPSFTVLKTRAISKPVVAKRICQNSQQEEFLCVKKALAAKSSL